MDLFPLRTRMAELEASHEQLRQYVKEMNKRFHLAGLDALAQRAIADLEAKSRVEKAGVREVAKQEKDSIRELEINGRIDRLKAQLQQRLGLSFED
jgi:hypothetical protein